MEVETNLTTATGVKGSLIHKRTQPLIVDFEDAESQRRSAKAARWFSDDIFSDINTDNTTIGKTGNGMKVSLRDLDDMLIDGKIDAPPNLAFWIASS